METKEKVTHTPTPWKVYGAGRQIRDEKENVVAIMRQFDDVLDKQLPHIENAAFIVSAVNSHEPLKIALTDIAKLFHDISNHSSYFHHCNEPRCFSNREILAQAEGK